MPGTDGASTREQQQIDLITTTVVGVVAHPEGWRDDPAGVDYLYRANRLIVRDANVDSVVNFFLDEEGLVEPAERQERATAYRSDDDPELAGATVLTVPDELWARREGDILPDLQRREGPGAVGYDHLFYVCNHSCAAIEPERPPAGPAVPVPRPQLYSAALSHHGAGVHVRVLDTGLVQDAATDHTWLAEVDGDLDPAGQGGSPIPQDGGHGTFTAGCVRVTAPEADVYVVNAVRDLPRNNGAPELGAVFESRLADVLRRQLVADEGQDPVPVPDVIVLNFAGMTRDGRPPVALAALYDSVIQHLAEPLILSPAGNEGDQRKNWPASFDWVVSVGGLAGDGTRASWSNHGRSVDVYAPGDRLVNAYAKGAYTPTWDGQPNAPVQFQGMALWSGTSFSTPLVAGLVAARMSSTGQSSRRAWESLLGLAERQAVPGLGPVLYPGQELA